MTPHPVTVPHRPVLKPWYRVLYEDDRVLVQYGESLVAFEGQAAGRLLPALLPLLDGTRTLDEIVEVVGPAVRVAVEHALALLDEHGLLTEAAPHVAGPDRRSAEFLAATDPLGRSPAELLEAVGAARVGIVGAGSLASEVAASLRRSGVGKIAAPSSLRAEPEGLELAVVAPCGEELADLGVWNEAALAAGLPWLQVLPYDGHLAAVGPFYVPGETACYECFRIRRSANVDCGREQLALQRMPATLPAPAGLEQTVAGLAAILALRWLVHRDQFLPGTWYALELADRLALGAHMLYRLPRCPACAGLGALAQPLPWHKGEATAA